MRKVINKDKIKTTRECIPQKKGSVKKEFKEASAIQPYNATVELFKRNPLPGSLTFLTTEVLKKEGRSPLHSPYVQVIVAALISCRTGMPTPIIIFENENGQAHKMLSSCLDLIDKNSIVELNDRNQNKLFNSYRDLEGKTVIAFNLEILRKGKMGLMTLVQKNMNDNKTNFIAVANGSIDEFDNYPGVLRITLPPDDSITDTFFLDISDPKHQADLIVEKALLKKLYKRMKKYHVDISYIDQLKKAFKGQIKYGQAKFEILLRFLWNYTIINNLKSETEDERRANSIGVDLVTFLNSKYASEQDYHFDEDNNNTLVSKKEDYYSVWVEQNIILFNEGSDISTHQVHTFDAIKSYNWQYLKSTFADINKLKDVMNTLYSNQKAWATIEDVIDYFKTELNREINMKDVEEDIRSLLKNNYIRQRSYHQSKDRGVFCVSTPSISAYIKLPHPSEIIDPINNDKKVQVVNPNTGKTEII